MKFAADFRAEARAALAKKWGVAVLAGFLAVLLGGIDASSSITVEASDFSMFWLVYSLVIILIGGAIELGYCQFNLELIRGGTPQTGVLFSQFSSFGRAFCLRLVKGIFILLWSLLFIVPGIIASYRYAMASYIMSENEEMGPLDAIRASKEMMQGNKGRLFCLDLSFIGWALLSVLTLTIGGLWLTPYVQAARAAFYVEISGTGRPVTEAQEVADGNLNP